MLYKQFIVFASVLVDLHKTVKTGGVFKKIRDKEYKKSGNTGYVLDYTLYVYNLLFNATINNERQVSLYLCYESNKDDKYDLLHFEKCLKRARKC